MNIRRSKKKSSNYSAFQKISLFFYDRPRITAVIFLALIAFGIASYTTLLRREGFPSINVPFSLVSGAYIVNDPAKVDRNVNQPLSEFLVKQDGVKSVDAQAGANFYTIAIEYKEGVDSKAASSAIEQKAKAAHVIPANTVAKFQPLSIGVDEQGHDMLVAFYAKDGNRDMHQLYQAAQQAADYLKQNGNIKSAQSIEAVDPFVHGVDPVTGKASDSQKIFDRYTSNVAGNVQSNDSVVIGIKGVPGFDVLDLDKQVRAALASFNSSDQVDGHQAVVSYSAAPDIQDQISGLQHSLLDGLVAVLVMSAILIALRASLITVSAMSLVLLITLGVLDLIGYSLNTITLFSLILCLSLIVDDTIIMVEAIDAQRRKSSEARDVIKKATRKISRAMLAATLTATIGFAPLIFVTGILGSFIKAIPITVITSLIVSLIVALTFIPFASRYILLRPKHLGKDEKESPSHHLETFIAKTVARPLMWTNHNRKRQVGLGIVALIVGFGFIMAGGALFQEVTFNIFPPDKDGNNIAVTLTYEPNTSIEQAQKIAASADDLAAKTLGKNFRYASYYNSGNAQTAMLNIQLLDFKKRVVTSPELATQLEQAFKGFKGASVQSATQGVGPNDAAFSVQVITTDREKAYNLAKDLNAYMTTLTLTRLDGSQAHMKSVVISNPDTVLRKDGKEYVKVSSEFDATDTSTLVTLAQNAIKEKYNSQELAKFGLPADTIKFDTGTEGDFQNSFKTLLFAFPILLVAIYFLLVTQFRSLLQPILIFMAIPFSLFGITAGLWLTHNAFSFFSMLGFFALLGLSIKNTILLTDYANQARRSGSNAVEAVSISLQERFRPLIATSLTAIVSLIPLYLSNPFWEGLTVTLMFGLLSSTFLVITVFPYYYLGAEYLRLRIRRRTFLLWLCIAVILSAGAVAAGQPKLVPVIMLFSALGLGLAKSFAFKPRAAA